MLPKQMIFCSLPYKKDCNKQQPYYIIVNAFCFDTVLFYPYFISFIPAIDANHSASLLFSFSIHFLYAGVPGFS